MRTHIKPPYTKEAINKDDEEDVIEDVYDVATRDESYGYHCNVPLIFFHVVEIHLSIRVCK